MNKHQTHCQTCLRVFEAESLEDVIRKVEEHENKKSCKRPVYDAKEGRFVETEKE